MYRPALLTLFTPSPCPTVARVGSNAVCCSCVTRPSFLSLLTDAFSRSKMMCGRHWSTAVVVSFPGPQRLSGTNSPELRCLYCFLATLRAALCCLNAHIYWCWSANYGCMGAYMLCTCTVLTGTIYCHGATNAWWDGTSVHEAPCFDKGVPCKQRKNEV